MKKVNWKKVLVIGSGPIVIGQAAEFDYAGTQACRALREEGIEVVLVNSNPATIMTDREVADRVYIEPLTIEFLERIIERERPDGLIATMGGQTGLNMAFQLAEKGILERNGVKLMGTSLAGIKKAEDRDLFRSLMREINEPVPPSVIVEEIEEAVAFANSIGYPVIVRPAYTLGGTGGGIANDEDTLRAIAKSGIQASLIGQILVEKSVAGWKEIEFEVIRDGQGNCITVCNMENLDPVGVHTGDSHVVAPSQTLNELELKTLNDAAWKIVDALGIAGGCNVQYALHPERLEYVVIEVNPRLSRSSALASKATGYPIAKIAAKIALGYTLPEIPNPVTGKDSAYYEPALDYVAIKLPRWPFDKFSEADRHLGTQMKATGEVLGLGRNLETAILKGIRSLEIKVFGILLPELENLTTEELKDRLQKPDDEILFVIAEGLRRGLSVSEINEVSKWNPFFLEVIARIVKLTSQLQETKWDTEILIKAKKLGFSDKEIARLWDSTEAEVYQFRLDHDLKPVFKMVNTSPGEFKALTPYFYSSYDQGNESKRTDRRKIVVLGSGPIRIGQGIEFDYCSVHSVIALKEAGIETIIINNNPETVSTDFDTADRLYFEPLTLEDVSAVLDLEKPEGVIVQFGGQTAIGLAKPLAERGYKILGTSIEDIDRAEERGLFDQVLNAIGAKRPLGGQASTLEEARLVAERIGYPLMVRPSFVLGGRAMEIVYSATELDKVVNRALAEFLGQEIWMDQYLVGKEVEVDGISDGENVSIPGIMEHLERAGVHSGDSIAVYPPVTLTQEIKERIANLTTEIARSLHVKGLLNIQYVIHQDEVYVIEVNPRSSRTVPFISKVTGKAIVDYATKVIAGSSLADLGLPLGLWADPPRIAVKVPVFSFSKLTKVEPSLGPEMKSTGEVMGIDKTYEKALFKALLAAGYSMVGHGTLLVTLADRDKQEGLELVARFAELGFRIIATEGTAKVLAKAGIEVKPVAKLHQGSNEITAGIRQGQIQCVLNTTTHNKKHASDGFVIRRAAVEQGIPCFTSLDTASAWVHVLTSLLPSLMPLG